MLKLIRIMVWIVLLTIITGFADWPMFKDEPPKIADLVYIPQRAPVDEGKSTAIIGTFDITYENGETAYINTEAFDAQGNKVASGSFPLNDAALKTSGTLGFGIDMNTSRKGDYTFEVYIIDSKGRPSNRLDGTFKVTGVF